MLGDIGLRRVCADDPPAHHQPFFLERPKQPGFDVADAGERKSHNISELKPSGCHDDTVGSAADLSDAAKKLIDRLPTVAFHVAGSDLRGATRPFAVTQAVNDRHKHPPSESLKDEGISIDFKRQAGTRCSAEVEQGWRGSGCGGGPMRVHGYRTHLRMVTIVPRPAAESISISSISRLAPGSPNPSPPLVEKPAFIASSRSAIPGPWSSKISSMPERSACEIVRKRMCPDPA
jgi:hypothetical protein